MTIRFLRALELEIHPYFQRNSVEKEAIPAFYEVEAHIIRQEGGCAHLQFPDGSVAYFVENRLFVILI